MKNDKNAWGVVMQLLVVADTRTVLESSIKIALTEHSSVESWSEKDGMIVFFWNKDAGKYALPSPIRCESKIVDLVIGWLDNQDYKNSPDIDGSVVKGFTLRCGGRSGYEVFDVAPTWIIYGK